MNRALALVRPVSMSDDTASDWLAAAVAETADMSDYAFQAAVAKARKTCTYHGQIIPTVTAELVQAKKPDPFAWAMACHKPSKPYVAIDNDRTGQKRIGDVVKRLGYEGEE